MIILKVKVELTNGEIKEYEIVATNMPYMELIKKMKEDKIEASQIKKIIS